MDGKWQKTEVSQLELAWLLSGIFSLVADNFSQFEYDGINKYESREDFPARKEGEEYFGLVIRGGCDVYFNTEKKFSGIEFNVNYYYENTMKYYYAYLNLDYTPLTVTLPTVE